MENKRNTFVISKALKGFVLASVLTAAAGQLGGTLDVVVLAQFVGEEAVSALSLVMPVTTLISCTGLLMAFGANALAARAIGRHDRESAVVVFSTAIWSILTIGVLFSLLMYASLPTIVRVFINEESLRALPTEYLRIYVLGAWLEMLSYALCLFVATDGHPRRVTAAVAMGVTANLLVDVLAVGFLDWGIQGVAWGTLSQFAVNVLLLGCWIQTSSNSYRLTRPGRQSIKVFLQNIQEGAPVTISNVLMAFTVVTVNHITYEAQGDMGLFYWSVCLQVLLIAAVVVNGVMEALFAIGGVLVGEHDLSGFSILTRRALLMVVLLTMSLVALLWIPDAVGVVFGIEHPEKMADMNHVMRSFSLLLPPFSLTLILVAAYQVMERWTLSVVVVVGQLCVLVVAIWLFANNTPDDVWFGFPIGATLFLGGQLLYTWLYSRSHGCRVSGLTLIPYSEGGHSLDYSVVCRENKAQEVLRQTAAFLRKWGVSDDSVSRLEPCLDTLMTNVVQHASRRPFDLHVYTSEGRAWVTLKSGGSPYNPVEAAMTEAGSISYKYMYGLNTILIIL